VKLTVQQFGLTEAQKLTRELFSDRRANAAFASALTAVAVDVVEAIKKELPAALDRPTPYTMNSMFVKPARADRLEAEAFFKDELGTSKLGRPATKYLRWLVYGGVRSVKAFESAMQKAGYMEKGWVAVPGAGARVDQYGNVSPGQIIQILSQLRVTLTAGHTRNMGFGAKSIAAQRRAGGRFFAVPARTKGGLAPGIYQREFGGQNIAPVFIFVSRAQYSRRLDFYGIARQVSVRNFPGHLDRAFGAHLARLAARRGGGA
jgi:hypothetical protein